MATCAELVQELVQCFYLTPDSLPELYRRFDLAATACVRGLQRCGPDDFVAAITCVPAAGAVGAAGASAGAVTTATTTPAICPCRTLVEHAPTVAQLLDTFRSGPLVQIWVYSLDLTVLAQTMLVLTVTKLRQPLQTSVQERLADFVAACLTCTRVTMRRVSEEGVLSEIDGDVFTMLVLLYKSAGIALKTATCNDILVSRLSRTYTPGVALHCAEDLCRVAMAYLPAIDLSAFAAGIAGALDPMLDSEVDTNHRPPGAPRTLDALLEFLKALLHFYRDRADAVPARHVADWAFIAQKLRMFGFAVPALVPEFCALLRRCTDRVRSKLHTNTAALLTLLRTVLYATTVRIEDSTVHDLSLVAASVSAALTAVALIGAVTVENALGYLHSDVLCELEGEPRQPRQPSRARQAAPRPHPQALTLGRLPPVQTNCPRLRCRSLAYPLLRVPCCCRRSRRRWSWCRASRPLMHPTRIT